MKSPFIRGSRGGPSDISGETIPALFQKTGRNTGNILFISAVRKLVVHDRTQKRGILDPITVREQNDGIIMPAANWLNETTDLGGLAQQLEEADLPCVIVGLGAQSETPNTIPKLLPGTERLVKVISERCRSLSVRGTFTAEVLEHYGVKNVTVTGCPSLLWKVTEPVQLTKKDVLPESISVHTNMSQYSLAVLTENRRGNEVSRTLLRQAFERDWWYVAQSELPCMYFALGRHDEEGMHERNVTHLKKIYATEDVSRLESYLTRKSKVFFDVESWLAFLSQRDFSIGTRIHGTIAALLAGTPAVLLTHDTRTTELADAMNIPRIDVGILADQTEIDVESVYADLSLDAFNRAYFSYYERFVEFFESNEVPTHLDRNLRRKFSEKIDAQQTAV